MFLFRGLLATARHHGLLTTGRGEQRTVTLSDGSRLDLNTDTRLRVRFNSNARQIIFDSGEAYFSVVHESRPFVVVLGDRAVTAVGTAFTVRRDQASGATAVTMIEGRVSVTSNMVALSSPRPNNDDITSLHAGQRLQWVQFRPADLDSPSLEQATAWRGGQLIFDHTPLLEALAEFNRYSRTQIRLAAPQLNSSSVGGRFRIEDGESFARAVAAAHHLHVRIEGDTWILE